MGDKTVKESEAAESGGEGQVWRALRETVCQLRLTGHARGYPLSYDT